MDTQLRTGSMSNSLLASVAGSAMSLVLIEAFDLFTAAFPLARNRSEMAGIDVGGIVPTDIQCQSRYKVSACLRVRLSRRIQLGEETQIFSMTRPPTCACFSRTDTRVPLNPHRNEEHVGRDQSHKFVPLPLATQTSFFSRR